MKFKKIIPSSLLGRSLIIVFIPIITLVTLTTIIFYQTSWNIISKRLTQSVVADINAIVKLIDQDLQFTAIKLAKEDFKMKVELKENANIILPKSNFFLLVTILFIDFSWIFLTTNHKPIKVNAKGKSIKNKRVFEGIIFSNSIGSMEGLISSELLANEVIKYINSGI